jgi:hypothetical protein
VCRVQAPFPGSRGIIGIVPIARQRSAAITVRPMRIMISADMTTRPASRGPTTSLPELSSGTDSTAFTGDVDAICYCLSVSRLTLMDRRE